MMRAGHLLVPPPFVPADLCADTQAAGFTFMKQRERENVHYDIHRARTHLSIYCDDRQTHTLAAAGSECSEYQSVKLVPPSA